MGLVQDTVFYAGKKYAIIVHASLINGILIEIATTRFNYDSLNVEFIQVRSGTLCYESNNITSAFLPDGQGFIVSNFPKWVLNSNASAIAKLTFDSTVYFVRDSTIN